MISYEFGAEAVKITIEMRSMRNFKSFPRVTSNNQDFGTICLIPLL